MTHHLIKLILLIAAILLLPQCFDLNRYAGSPFIGDWLWKQPCYDDEG
ncbi:MAG: hypothetical protein K2N25_09875 [Muribaculaceae bacterium]|nr:hypothetical protein [Muribaculaceae bacterium]